MRVQTRESGGIAGPAKWAAVGALGGAAIMGVIGSLVLRQPRDLVAADPAPLTLHAFAATPQPPATPPAAATPPSSPPTTAPPPPAPATPAQAPSNPPNPPISPNPEPATTTPSAPVPASAPATVPATTSKPSTPPAPKSPVPQGRLNVNKATQAELELLPGIGPAMAKRIIEFRSAHGSFKRIEDLDKVKGIGPKTLDKLRPLVTIE